MEYFQGKYVKQKKSWDALPVIWVCVGGAGRKGMLRAPLTSFSQSPFSVVTPRRVQCGFSEQFVSNCLSGSSLGNCSNVGLMTGGWQFSVPGTATGSCLLRRSHSQEPNQALPHVLFAWGCLGCGQPGWEDRPVRTAQLSFNCPLGQAGPILPWGGECGRVEGKKQTRKEGHSLREPPASAAREWDMCLMGRGKKQGRKLVTGMILSFCVSGSFNLGILQTRLIVERFGHIERFPTVVLAGEDICKFALIVRH